MTSPPNDFRITINGISDLPDTTRAALRVAITKHGNDIVAEAIRIEEVRNSNSTPLVITPRMIDDTANLILNGYIQRRPSRRRGWATLVGGVTTFGGGAFVNNIGEWWGAAGFAVCVVIVAICVILGEK